MKPLRIFFILIILTIPAVQFTQAQSGSPSRAFRALEEEKVHKIAILWTSKDRDIFFEAVEPYCEACFTNRNYEDLTLIVWGPSVCLLSKDASIRKQLALLIEKGMNVKASGMLSAKYNCREMLTEIGAEISNVNELLTDLLRDENRRIVSL